MKNIRVKIWMGPQREATTDLQAFDSEMETLLNAPMFPVIGTNI